MAKKNALSVSLPAEGPRGRVVAIVVGIEDYQVTPSGPALPKVDFARNDANGFVRALESIYPRDRLDIQQFIDSDATMSSLDYALKQTIEGLTPDDLFVFYYAGHGFHGADGNRITAWDSRPFNIEGSTILMQAKLNERLATSSCERALAFVDACATKFTSLVQARDVVTNMDMDELKAFLSSATYSAIFLSCKPGQKSYPSQEHGHGVWTYFLLKALRGEAGEALGASRYITATSLQDYLQSVVPRYVTNRLSVKGNQNPRAIIDQSNTFQIRYVPEPAVPMAEAGDLSPVRLTPHGEYLEAKEEGRVKSLDGFDKQRHRIYPTVSTGTNEFVRGLLKEQIGEEIDGFYKDAKKALGLPAKDLNCESEGGDGSLDCAYFRFQIEGQQDPDDGNQYIITKRLELREGWEEHEVEIDDIFGSIFDRLVVEFKSRGLKYDDLVEFFEGIERAHGGDLNDEPRAQRINYRTDDGIRIVIDLSNGRLTLAGGVSRSCSELVAAARQYRFTLDGPSRLLLSSA